MPFTASVSSKTQKKRNNVSGHSRKRRAVSHIPTLKHSFDVLEHEVKNILKETADPKQRVKKLQEVWRKLFGRPVEAVAAQAYLRVKSKAVGSSKTRKRGQSGGAAIAGAPLDFQTRPGVDGVHGSFPPYLTSGLSFYGTVNQDQLNRGVGLSAFDPAVPADMGSNKVGGGMLSDIAFLATTRPIAPSPVPTPVDDLQTWTQGRPLGSSPDSSQNQLKYM